ncbi:2-hydroxyacid dehydrogenase [Mycolicibacterium chitae]|uniref:D-isomer specific 2-hydroxyacid dehydrogenase NAD-binding protein n=1 Tax=Mycolicibacterium chitae TaxID=1792 RepID=A0A3S4RI56_MYCCI|nr:D-2-hydroxyacid dehydrogenase [Mycolicibacterium chitae]BBZ02243.1 2-hydroxyacid dehydrogenase [Mycolicibacterium chitae]VEG44444.1 D-isomer specific 2-hydroxyacid dehydrogenase NAD-binding protein [Mycolicibacterium chitae]
MSTPSESAHTRRSAGSGRGPALDSQPAIAVLCERPTDRPPGLSALSGVEFRYCSATGLAEALRGARGLLVWDYFSTALRDAWAQAAALEWVHVTAAGVDTLLFDALRSSDVVVTNARGVFDRPIAEYVLGAVLAHAKGSRESLDLQRRRLWRHRETRSVAGAAALVVGTGGIGRETARLLRAAGLRVRGAGRVARDEDPDFDRIVASADLAAEVGWCDHLVLAAPLTEATRGLVGREVLTAMKPDAHLVNVGRGPLLDEAELLTALRANRIGAATLDVFDTEPLPADHPLWEAPNLTITAHMAGDVLGWRDTLAAQFADNLERWLAGEPLRNVVDKRLGYVPGAAAASGEGR